MGEAKDGSKAVAAQVSLTPASLPACCGCLLQQHLGAENNAYCKDIKL